MHNIVKRLNHLNYRKNFNILRITYTPRDRGMDKKNFGRILIDSVYIL